MNESRSNDTTDGDASFSEQVQELFHAVAELSPGEQRRTIQDSAFPPAVRAEVQALLGWADRETDGSLLNESGLQAVRDGALDAAEPRFDPARLIGTSIDGYTLREVLGSGGMGIVYLADQSEPVERQVALKVIRLGMDSASILERFDRERRALAMMNHDTIARVFDAGTTERGQPYFVMELVDGRPLTEFCDDEQLTIPQRVRLFQQVCAGVEHAHQKGVLHRDLKPGNILVSHRAGEPVAKIIDFGVARALHEDRSESTLLTKHGAIVGTPNYMSPEQALGDVHNIDTRSDVYSLGVLLYELLTGELPLSEDDFRRAGLAEFQRRLREAEPRKPSTRLVGRSDETTKTASRRSATTERLRRELRGDLDWIALKALAKEPDRRYSSASELSADLQRHLAQQPVDAGSPSTWYRALKFVRRNRAAVGAAGMVFATAVGGAILALDQAQRANANATLAERRRAEADRNLQSAQRNAKAASTRAMENRVLAEKLSTKVDEFNLLSSKIWSDRALGRLATLYPGLPSQSDELQNWLNELDQRLERRAFIESVALRLRARAKEEQPNDRSERVRLHPDYDRWQFHRRTELEWARMMDVLEGRLEFTPPPLEESFKTLTAAELREEAWSRVAPGPARRVAARPMGLTLAESALEKLEDPSQRPAYLRVLAYAQLLNGLHTEAAATANRAMQECSEAEAESLWSDLRSLRDVLSAPEAYWLDARHDELAYRERTDEPQRWTFPEDAQADEFLHEALTALLRQLEVLDIRGRQRADRLLRWSRSVHRITFEHPHAELSWEEVRQQIATDPRFRSHPPDLRDEHVVGLIPLGPDRVTGLQEFWFARSCWDRRCDPLNLLETIPGRSPDGTIPFTAGSGIVMVLLPGGTFELGGQGRNPSNPRYHRLFGPANTIRRAQLDPFFIAKHELTQSQWSRLWEGAAVDGFPSGFSPGQPNPSRIDPTPRHPVESVNWNTATELLHLHGLDLPTAAQWEYACSAGSANMWSGPADGVRTFANVRDKSFRRIAQAKQTENWDDGFPFHAPVGSFAPNPFGLYDMHGNVQEFVRGDSYFIGRVRPGDGAVRADRETNFRASFGGDFSAGALDASCWDHLRQPVDFAETTLGLRPMRPVTPRVARTR